MNGINTNASDNLLPSSSDEDETPLPSPLLTPYLCTEEKTVVAIDLLFYCVFLTLFLIAFKLQFSGSNGYFFQRAIEFKLLDDEFYDIYTPADILPYINTSVLPRIYNKLSPNGTIELGTIAQYNRLIGKVKLSSQRVAKDSCEVPSLFKHEIEHCYGRMTDENEERTPFGPNGKWKWKSASQTSLFPWTGRINHYSGAGYVINFNKTLSDTMEIITELFEHNFIDIGTRLVTLDFAVYNPSLHTTGLIRVAFEIPSAGSVFTSTYFKSVKLFSAVTFEDLLKFGMEIVVVIGEFIYICLTINSMIGNSLRRCLRVWYFYLELITHVFFGIVIYYKTRSIITLNDFAVFDLEQVPFELLGYFIDRMMYALAVLAFLLVFKLFKFFRISHKLSVLIHVLAVAIPDILSFSVVFGVILVGFALMGHMSFGQDVFDFSTFKQSLMSLFRMLLTDFDYLALYKVDPIMGSFFLISFMSFGYYILMNFFIAIITDAFTLIRQAEDRYRECGLTSSMNRLTKKFFNRIAKLFGIKRRFDFVPKEKQIPIIDLLTADNNTDSGGLKCPHCKEKLKYSVELS
ncbi:hypothetical protein GEMRC1_002666 [Eukaryota sp. GEM-RC1]